MPRTLVTGGAGFIGSHIVEALLARGDQVRVLDDFSSGKEENLSVVLDEIELIKGDICDQGVIKSSVLDIDLIFHQAAFVSVPMSIEDPQFCFDVNVNGTIKLLSAAREAGVKRVVIASSAAVYGDNMEFPLKEDTSLHPKSPYATSKLVGELYTSLFSELLGLEVVALRYFNVYGSRQNPDSDYAAVIPIFIKTIHNGQRPVIQGDGKQTRDFIHINDVIRANLLAAEAPEAPGQVINICSGKETRILDLLNILMEIKKVDLQPKFAAERPGDIYRSLGDPSKAKSILGFEQRIDLEQGLKIMTASMGQGQTRVS
jgi:nucleoside-diphosphate-sugar epimerase